MAESWNNRNNNGAANFGAITYSGMPTPGAAPAQTPDFSNLDQHFAGQRSGLGGFINGLSQIGQLFHGGWNGGGQPTQPPAQGPQWPQAWQDWRTAIQGWRASEPVQQWLGQRPPRPEDRNHQSMMAYRQSPKFQAWRSAMPAGRPERPAGMPGGFGMGLGLGRNPHPRSGGLFSALMDRFGRG